MSNAMDTGFPSWAAFFFGVWCFIWGWLFGSDSARTARARTDVRETDRLRAAIRQHDATSSSVSAAYLAAIARREHAVHPYDWSSLAAATPPPQRCERGLDICSCDLCCPKIPNQ